MAAADQGEGDRLDQELHQDVLPAGAHRLAHADLAGALGHRDQHDVHDADAADQQGDADHAADHRGDAAQDAADRVEDLVLHLDLEVVGLRRRGSGGAAAAAG